MKASSRRGDSPYWEIIISVMAIFVSKVFLTIYYIWWGHAWRLGVMAEMTPSAYEMQSICWNCEAIAGRSYFICKIKSISSYACTSTAKILNVIGVATWSMLYTDEVVNAMAENRKPYCTNIYDETGTRRIHTDEITKMTSGRNKNISAYELYAIHDIHIIIAKCYTPYATLYEESHRKEIYVHYERNNYK